MTRKFDVVVIGTGEAASPVASRCRSAGWQVAVVDSRPFGGTCALRGCDPKKVLVGAADALDWIRRMQGKGIQAEKIQIDWQELMRFKRSFTEPVPTDREEEFAKAGIAAFHGRARFVGPSTVQVADEMLEGRYVVSVPGILKSAGFCPPEMAWIIQNRGTTTAGDLQNAALAGHWPIPDCGSRRFGSIT